MDNNAICLIFRVPEMGKVKTRLAKEVGEIKAYEYYKIMLNETIKKVLNLGSAALIGFYSGNKPINGYNFPLYKQKGKDLGEIILNAVKKLKSLGYRKIVVIGSDSPDMPNEFIKNAFEALDNTDFVIGPTEDGGFYLLGLTDIYNCIFFEVDWGSQNVFESLLKNITKLKKTFLLLPIWYDIDSKKELFRWLEKLT
jgi:rSAM/selenodomain-associated transferase 1